MGDENANKVLVVNVKERGNFGDMSTDGSKPLKWILKK
jgi:hypothetical protein